MQVLPGATQTYLEAHGLGCLVPLVLPQLRWSVWEFSEVAVPVEKDIKVPTPPISDRHGGIFAAWQSFRLLQVGTPGTSCPGVLAYLRSKSAHSSLLGAVAEQSFVRMSSDDSSGDASVSDTPSCLSVTGCLVHATMSLHLKDCWCGMPS